MSELHPIRGFPDYGINRSGSVFRVVAPSGGPGCKKQVPYEITQKYNKLGYKRVTMYTPCGRSLTKSAHRLVAEAFLKNPRNLPCVCHKDGSRDNNHVDNLRWDTHKGNSADRVLHGTCLSISRARAGSNHPLSKLTEQEVLEIRYLFNRGIQCSRGLASIYQVGRNYITQITNPSSGRWSHLPYTINEI